MFTNISNKGINLISKRVLKKDFHRLIKYFFNPKELSQINTKINPQILKENTKNNLDIKYRFKSNLKNFSKNMQNIPNDKEKLEEQKTKRQNIEDLKESNISRRNSLKLAKENISEEKLKKLNNELKEPYTLDEYNKLINNSKNSEIFITKLSAEEKRLIQRFIKIPIYLIFPLSFSVNKCSIFLFY